MREVNNGGIVDKINRKCIGSRHSVARPPEAIVNYKDGDGESE
ncbi:hypothetical protein [Nostoc sp.]